jgi:hypothetical protein
LKEVFVSYTTEDKTKAGKVKQILEANNITTFLFHDDLEVSAQWRTEILRHLNTSSALIAIVTENFANSFWANQEVGIAIGKGLPIIPLMFSDSATLRGFIETYQGIPVSESNLEEKVKRTIPAIEKGVSSTERQFYKDLAGILGRLTLRWQTYKSHTPNVKWIPEAIGEIKKNLRNESDALVKLMSDQTEIDFGVKSSSSTILSQIDLLDFFKIDFSLVYAEQVPQFQEFEHKGDQMSHTAQALRGWLQQTGKVSPQSQS